MGDFLGGLSDSERRARYPVQVLAEPEANEDGILHREAQDRVLLAWKRVERVIVAEVGEPEGVRTIVFDLIARSEGGMGVYRLDAEPGEEAMDLARLIERSVRAHLHTASLKSVATDGIPVQWYPDLRSFEEAVLSTLPAAADSIP